MAICTPPEWNTESIRNKIRKNYGNLTNNQNPIVVLEYTWANNVRGIPQLRAYVHGFPQLWIAQVTIQPFTAHCGIRAIQSPNVSYPVFIGDMWMPTNRLWIKTIESFLHNCEYSAIVASDGPGVTYDILRDAGWFVWNPGVNRRMGAAHQLYVMMKYLNDEPVMNINWKDASLIPPPENKVLKDAVSKVFSAPSFNA